MSTPQSQTPSVSSSLTPTEHQISYKKHIKIKNELNGKRRNALKEFYNLKQQQQTLQKEVQHLNSNGQTVDGAHNQINSEGEDEDDNELEHEISENRPVKEINLENAEFIDILKDTNKLTTSINLINSSIKNIIYNNYYELIKLNDFLKDLNELDISSLEETTKETKSGNLLDSFKTKELTKPSIGVRSEENVEGFDKLTSLMQEIEEFDQGDLEQVTDSVENDDSISTLLNLDLSKLKTKEDFDEAKQNAEKVITKLLKQVKSANGETSLIQQLENIEKEISTTSYIP